MADVTPTHLTNTESDSLQHEAERSMRLAYCQHCSRALVLVDGEWIDPRATGDDEIWRTLCDERPEGGGLMDQGHEPEMEPWCGVAECLTCKQVIA